MLLGVFSRSKDFCQLRIVSVCGGSKCNIIVALTARKTEPIYHLPSAAFFMSSFHCSWTSLAKASSLNTLQAT